MYFTFTFTENNQIKTTILNVTEVQERIILLKELKKEFGFFQDDELATLVCFLYNRQKGPDALELNKEAFRI